MELDEGSRSSGRSAGGPDRRRHSASSRRKRGDRDPYGLEDWRSRRNERASKRARRSRDDGDRDGAAAAAVDDERRRRRCDGDLVSGSAPPPNGPGELGSSPIPEEHAAADPPADTQSGAEPCSGCCLVLHNVFEASGEEDPEFYLDIRDSVHARCAQFGPVYHTHIDKDHGSVYLKFGTKRICTLARKGFHESLIDGRVITATFMSSRLYNDKFRAPGQSRLPNSWGA